MDKNMGKRDNIKVVISGSDGDLIQKIRGRVYNDVITSVEKSLIKKTLQRTEGNQSKAARILGITRNTLHTKIKKFNIDVDGFKL